MNQNRIQEIIQRFTINLNQQAKVSQLKLIGRETQIKQLTYILSRLIRNNPLLIGSPGVGKTAIVEGLVQRIKQNQVPRYLQGKTIYQLDMMSLRAGANFQGELEARLKVILNYMVQPENNAILFIDEIHMIVGDGGAQGVLNIANLLKPILSRGEIQCIGATTVEEYRRSIEKDGALTRRFSNLLVSEPTAEETLVILQGIRSPLEAYYGLKIYDEALLAAVKLSQRYLTTTYFPDKAIDLLDETCGRISSQMWYEPAEIEAVRRQLKELELSRTSLLPGKEKIADNFHQSEINSLAKKLNDLTAQVKTEDQIIEELNQKKKALVQAEQDLFFYRWEKFDSEKVREKKYSTIPLLQKEIAQLEAKASHNRLRKYFVKSEDLALTIAEKYNLPTEKILTQQRDKLLFLPVLLQARIKGQDHVLRTITRSIFRAWAGIQAPNRPLASFLFLGPTGVGKTEVALTIAEQLFDQKKNLIRLDMTEFSEPHSVSKLLGSPPGYIGFEERSRLEMVREKMNSVVLFDEIEKCHPEIINLLLQILDNGQITLTNGQEVSFRQTIVILTTNLGSEFYLSTSSQKELEENLNQKLKTHFPLEFLNRLDEIIFFNALGEKTTQEIIVRELETFKERVKTEKKIELKYNEKVVEKIFQAVYGKEEDTENLKEHHTRRVVEYGARPIKYYVEKEIGNLVAQGIITNLLRPEGQYCLELEKETNQIKLTRLSLLEPKKD
ncbi:MAG: ATP-dependent Clp protease ATP-binding subunit [Candidatus Moeniiplasma glomeromycotorum]|nr:ATP-dependent Clp protease ATP-binding subunit [Candidatus Moeniiplasma glomeromycotorum]